MAPRIRRWRPLLDGTEARRALAIVDEIATALGASGATGPHGPGGTAAGASLSGGAAGIAVFLAYRSLARGASPLEDAAAAALARADEGLAAGEMPIGLSNGLTGVAWAHAHLERNVAPPLRTDLGDIDDVVRESLSDPWLGEYELVHGLVGLGVYALERLPSRAGVELTRLVIARLAELAATTRAGVTWHSPPESRAGVPPGMYPDGHHNLGVAHGVPGVVAFLGAACAAGLGATALPLLEGAVRWLVAQRLADRSSAFPYVAAPGRPPQPARLAWCYGDAGIAAAIWLAGRGARRPEWRRAAVALARRAARRSFDTSGVDDATFCHGAAGLAQIFNRLAQASGDALLRVAARRWTRRVLTLREPGQGIAGYLHYRVQNGELGPTTAPGVLEGAAGVGLTLIAAATNVEPEWDRMFLLSSAPGPRA